MMITIEENYTQNSKKKHIINICNDNPNPKSYASYVLLKQALGDIAEHSYTLWLEFRHSFLEKKQEEELVCEFCGKRHLEIGEIKQSKLFLNNTNENLATIDHLLAKSKYPHLEYKEFNFAISCKKCNKRKDNLLLEEWVELNPQINWYSFFENHQEVLEYVHKLNKYQLEFV